MFLPNVLDERACLEQALHLAEADVFSVMQLDQVLLAVYDFQRSQGSDFANVPGAEPPKNSPFFNSGNSTDKWIVTLNRFHP